MISPNQVLTSEEIKMILNSSEWGVLSTSNDNFPYGVPVNYVYIEEDNALYIHGGNANAKGRYLFETFTSQTNRNGLALPFEWNSMESFKQFQIKPDTVMIVGDASAQFNYGNQYIGGANQWYINSLEDLLP